MSDTEFMKLLADNNSMLLDAMDKRFADQDESIDAKFRKYDESIDAKFRKYDESIDARFRKYDESIDAKFAHNNGLLLEAINDQFSRVIEAIDDVREQVKKIPKIESDIAELTTEMKTVKAVLSSTNADVADHEIRISKLELAA